MNVEQVLAQKRLEMFTASGVSPDVAYARAAAWNALRLILGGVESDELWRLQAVNYGPAGVPGATPAVAWTAEFVRTPDEE